MTKLEICSVEWGICPILPR